METIKLIEISCCVGFGLVFGGGAAFVLAKVIYSLGEATTLKLIGRILK